MRRKHHAWLTIGQMLLAVVVVVSFGVGIRIVTQGQQKEDAVSEPQVIGAQGIRITKTGSVGPQVGRVAKKVETNKATQEQKKPLTLQEIHDFVRENKGTTH